jgi:hypothetical protein
VPAEEATQAFPAVATGQAQVIPAELAPAAEQTQILPVVPAPAPAEKPAAGGEAKPAEGEPAQRNEAFETSIWRLQEARRILQGQPQDP